MIAAQCAPGPQWAIHESPSRTIGEGKQAVSRRSLNRCGRAIAPVAANRSDVATSAMRLRSRSFARDQPPAVAQSGRDGGRFPCQAPRRCRAPAARVHTREERHHLRRPSCNDDLVILEVGRKRAALDDDATRCGRWRACIDACSTSMA